MKVELLYVYAIIIIHIMSKFDCEEEIFWWVISYFRCRLHVCNTNAIDV